jgi:hypothetical protein
MRVVSVCIALVVASFLSVPAARAQSREKNEHYRSLGTGAIETQRPNPVPNLC